MTDVELNKDVLEANDAPVNEEAPVEKEPEATILSVEEPAVAEEPVATEDPVVVEESVILAPEPEEETPAIVPVANNVIGSGKTKKKAENTSDSVKTENVEKVALFADRNIVWNGIGKLVKGYNLVPKDTAEKWLTLKTVREASPQEVKAKLG